MCEMISTMRIGTGIIVTGCRATRNFPRMLDFRYALGAQAPRTGYNQHVGGAMEDGSSSAGDVKRQPQPQEKLVRVFDAEQESEVMVVCGLLESQGIDADVTSLDAQQDILPGVGGTVILVREEDAAKARQIIEEYRRAPGEEDTADFEITGGPTPEE
jgi:hypothetical protein